MTATMADTLSMLGLVAGFPLLLLCFMLSLEKLESWGLGEDMPKSQRTQRDRVAAAVEQVEQLAAAQQPSVDATDETAEAAPVVAVAPPSGGAERVAE